MEIRTKFGLGDKVWVIRNLRAEQIEVNAVIADESGVWVRAADAYYPMFREDACFPTKEALIKHILGNGDESV